MILHNHYTLFSGFTIADGTKKLGLARSFFHLHSAAVLLFGIIAFLYHSFHLHCTWNTAFK